LVTSADMLGFENACSGGTAHVPSSSDISPGSACAKFLSI
jgi:hypothetical protein